MEWFLYISIGFIWGLMVLLYLIYRNQFNDRKKLVLPEHQPPAMARDYFIPSMTITLRKYNDFKPKNTLLKHNFVEIPNVDLLDVDVIHYPPAPSPAPPVSPTIEYTSFLLE